MLKCQKKRGLTPNIKEIEENILQQLLDSFFNFSNERNYQIYENFKNFLDEIYTFTEDHFIKNFCSISNPAIFSVL